MPFTLAHPAAVLPLRATWRDGFWGLVFGSLGPDIPYFLPVRLGEALPKTHNPWGAMTVAAPLALLLLLLVVTFRQVLTAPLWGALRVSAATELATVLRSPVSWLHLIPAAVVGAEIHLLWDSFTHKEGWMVLHVSALAVNVSPLDGYPLKLFRALQYASSLIGMAALAASCRPRLKRESTERPAEVAAAAPAGRPWALAAAAVISLGAAGSAVLASGPRPGHSHTAQYVAATTAVASFVALYVLLGTAYALRDAVARGAPRR
jgi:Domain of unknown function (DUF4184)